MNIPPGWSRVRLGGNVEIYSGVAPAEAKPRADGSFPYIKVEDLNNSAKYQFSARQFTDRAKGVVPSGSVVFPKRGGAIMTNKVRLSRVDLVMDTNLMALHPSSRIDPEFLFYALSHAGLSKLADTSTIPQINNKHIIPFQICLPPLPEQRKTAEILRTWDDAIELAEAHIAGLKIRRDWLRMEVLTGRVRMGDHAGPWSKTPLRGVLKEHKLRSGGSEEVFSVSVHKGLVNQKEHLGRSFAAANTNHYNLVNSGDIVYTKSPTGDFPLGIIKRSSAPGAVIVSPLYGVFTPQNPDLGVILDAYFESPRTVQNYLSPLVQKGAKNTISITNQGFLSGHLTLPVDPEEQSDLATLLTASRDEIAAGQRKAELLRTQKRGLLEKLLTGQVRVNVSTDTEPGDHEDD